MEKRVTRLMAGVALVASALVAAPLSASADAIEDFYKGKTVSLIVSVQEGGGTDTVARLLSRHWPTVWPGKPTIVVKNMPGAGHLRATNYLYSQAPQDGTTIAAIAPGFVMHQILDGRSVQYDAARMKWIGSTGATNAYVYTWHTAGIKTLEDAMKKEVLMGGTGAGSDNVMYAVMLNNALGTRFKVIMGYKGTNDIDLAVARGEVQGRAGGTFSTLVANNMDWVTNKQIDILVQVGAKPEPGFESVPMLVSFAKDNTMREVLQIFTSAVELGRPFQAPPEIPADRLAALRSSFMAILKDESAIADLKKARFDVKPVSGADLQTLAAGMVNVSPEVIERVKAVLEPKGTVSEEKK